MGNIPTFIIDNHPKIENTNATGFFMMNTTPVDKIYLDVKSEPELKTLLSKLQPGDELELKGAVLQLDQSDENSAVLSILEIEFKQPTGAMSGGGDTADNEAPGLKVIKGDQEEADETPDEEAQEEKQEEQKPA